MEKIIRTTPDNGDFRYLVNQLDCDLAIRDGKDHSFYAQFNKSTGINHALVAYADGTPAGIGALRPYNADTVEIKRMFVIPQYRGLGVAILILAELEAWARELNFKSCILETGKKQPEAIGLYNKSGYQRIPNFGPYINIDNSVCMKKEIVLPVKMHLMSSTS